MLTVNTATNSTPAGKDDYRTAIATPWPRAKWRSTCELPPPGTHATPGDASAKPVKAARWRANKSIPLPGKGTKALPSKKWRTQTIFSAAGDTVDNDKNTSDEATQSSSSSPVTVISLTQLAQLRQLQQLQQLQQLSAMQHQLHGNSTANAPLLSYAALLSEWKAEGTNAVKACNDAPREGNSHKPSSVIEKRRPAKPSAAKKALEAMGDAASVLKMIASSKGQDDVQEVADENVNTSFTSMLGHDTLGEESSQVAEAMMQPTAALLALATAGTERAQAV